MEPENQNTVHTLTVPLEDLRHLVNRTVLMSRYLGYRGSFSQALQAGEEKACRLRKKVEALEKRAKSEGWLQCKALYTLVKARSSQDGIYLQCGKREAFLSCNRQSRPPHLSVADFVSKDPQSPDTVGLFVVNSGTKYPEAVSTLEDQGRYLESVSLQGLAMVYCEATAAYLHRHIRRALAWHDQQGERFSFGYSPLPIEAQRVVFDLLSPQGIGVQLSCAYMMEPENSVSALVIGHENARHFRVLEGEGDE